MRTVQRVAVWHGSDEVLRRLVQAVMHNCQCDGTIRGTCGSHRMLVDQAALDRFALVLDERRRYYQGEGLEKVEWWRAAGEA